jgi:hypothetical protein
LSDACRPRPPTPASPLARPTNLHKRGHGSVPAEAEEWSLATLHERLVKTGARNRVRRDFPRIDLLRPAALGMKHREQGAIGPSMMDEELLEGDPILSRARKAVPSTLRAPF